MFVSMSDILNWKYNNTCNTWKLKEKGKYLSVVYLLVLLHCLLTSLHHHSLILEKMRLIPWRVCHDTIMEDMSTHSQDLNYHWFGYYYPYIPGIWYHVHNVASIHSHLPNHTVLKLWWLLFHIFLEKKFDWKTFVSQFLYVKFFIADFNDNNLTLLSLGGSFLPTANKSL